MSYTRGMPRRVSQPPAGEQLEKIIEGVGFGSIAIDRTTAAEAVYQLGKEHHLVQHGSYSCSLVYPGLGVSLYFWSQDPAARVFHLTLRAPFRGVTSRGVVLGQTTMREAAALYGRLSWFTSQGAATWGAAYPGVEFFVERDLSLPPFPLDEGRHIDRPIAEIGLKSPHHGV